MKIIEIFDYRKMKKKINTLENKNEELKNIIKNKLYNDFMDNVSLKYSLEILTTENKKLKEENKLLKKEKNIDNKSKK